MRDRQRARADNGSTVYQAGRDLIVHHVRSPPDRAWNLPPRNPHFTGRDDLLVRVGDRMEAAAGGVTTLRGLGGIGKSQTAVEYAHRHADAYRWVWWIPSERAESIPTHLAGLGVALGLPEDERVLPRLSSLLNEHGRWLLIFDNAGSPADVHAYLPTGGHVLITTRSTGFAALGPVEEVDTLPRADSTVFLRARVPSLTQADADDIADVVGDYPLALAQAAAYLDETALPAANYLRLLRDRHTEVLPENAVVGYPHTTDTVWDLSLERLREQEPPAADLLESIVFFAADDVPLELFEGFVEDAVFTRVVGALVRHGLVRRHDDAVSVHRLLRARVRRDADPRLHLNALHLVRRRIPVETRGRPEQWPRSRRFLPHVLELADTCPEDDREAADAVLFLLVVAGRALTAAGRPKEARPVFERALALLDTFEQPEPVAVERVTVALSAVLKDLGEPRGAMTLLRRAMDTRDPVPGDYLLEHYADLLSTIGDHETAINVLTGLARDLELRQGPDSPDLLRALNNLAAALVKAGHVQQAAAVARTTHRLAVEHHPAEHENVTAALANLAAVLVESAPGTALELIDSLLSTEQVAALPGAHPQLAVYWNTKAFALSALGESEEAREWAGKALDIVLEVYGPNHPQAAELRELL